MAFQLDTSGAVALAPTIPRPGCIQTVWDDLSPFTQGYVEALFEDNREALLKPGRAGVFAGFSDLAH